ncbi:MAG: hypothetical protein N3G18_05415 [Candidatus Saccharicenans sp.]|nr:hypothetical protein [Candidatus Saccharicenans sp.]
MKNLEKETGNRVGLNGRWPGHQISHNFNKEMALILTGDRYEIITRTQKMVRLKLWTDEGTGAVEKEAKVKKSNPARQEKCWEKLSGGLTTPGATMKFSSLTGKR